jgi:hypothetical protein
MFLLKSAFASFYKKHHHARYAYKQFQLAEISGSHGGEYEDNLLECSGV